MATATKKKETIEVSEPAVVPFILGPLVTIELCDKARVPHGCSRKRNSVVDPLDGREWVVQWEDDVLVAQKTGASAGDQQAFSQYERLRKVLGDARHRAKAYSEAFEGQKVNDVAELTEASRAEVERIVQAAEDAQKVFDAFEVEHPECLRRRYLSEASYHRTQALKFKAQADKYEEGVKDWEKRIAEVALSQGEDAKDDHLIEMKESCRIQMEAERAKQEEQERTVAKLEKAAARLPQYVATIDRIELRPGQSVCIQG